MCGTAGGQDCAVVEGRYSIGRGGIPQQVELQWILGALWGVANRHLVSREGGERGEHEADGEVGPRADDEGSLEGVIVELLQLHLKGTGGGGEVAVKGVE